MEVEQDDLVITSQKNKQQVGWGHESLLRVDGSFVTPSPR